MMLTSIRCCNGMKKCMNNGLHKSTCTIFSLLESAVPAEGVFGRLEGQLCFNTWFLTGILRRVHLYPCKSGIAIICCNWNFGTLDPSLLWNLRVPLLESSFLFWRLLNDQTQERPTLLASNLKKLYIPCYFGCYTNAESKMFTGLCFVYTLVKKNRLIQYLIVFCCY